MVDPASITNFNLDTRGLQEHILFWVLAAGKNGTTAAKILNKILKDVVGPGLPFVVLSALNKEDLVNLFKDMGVGCYTHKARTVYELVNSNIDLSTCSADELETIYGIGRKTSRCFLIHSRRHAKYAGLDTHVLKFLRSKGHDAPKSTPASKKRYLELEKIFLTYVKESGKMVSEFDLEIWNKYKVISKSS